MKSLRVGLLLALGAAPAAAGTFGADAKLTAGPNRYRGAGVSAAYEHPAGWEGSLGANVSRSAASSTTLAAYSGRLGYFTDAWSAGVFGGLTPKADLYAANSVGADASWTFLRAEGGWELAADLAYARIHHEDEAPTCPLGRRRCLRRNLPATRLVELDQNDLTGGLRARRGPWSLTLSGTSSLYDQGLDTMAAPRGRTLPGLASAVESYPASNLFAKLGRDLGTRVWAWGSAARTTFHLGEPALLSLELGAGASLGKGFELSLSANRQKNSADPAGHYVSLGLAWRSAASDDEPAR